MLAKYGVAGQERRGEKSVVNMMQMRIIHA